MSIAHGDPVELSRVAAEYRVKVVITNGKALNAFRRAIDRLHDIVHEQPWNDDAKAALKELRYASARFTIRKER